MDTQILGAIIGASATMISVILAFLLNRLSKKLSDKRYRSRHNIRDITGTWETKWIYGYDKDETIIQCTNHIKMSGRNSFEGKGGNERWSYSLRGNIDEMGILYGTWQSLIDNYKGTFLLKVKPSLRRIEGHISSLALEEDFREGRWVWDLRTRA